MFGKPMDEETDSKLDNLRGVLKITPYILLCALILSVAGIWIGCYRLIDIFILAGSGIILSAILYFHWAKPRFISLIISLMFTLYVPGKVIPTTQGSLAETVFCRLSGLSVYFFVTFLVVWLLRKKYEEYYIKNITRRCTGRLRRR